MQFILIFVGVRRLLEAEKHDRIKFVEDFLKTADFRGDVPSMNILTNPETDEIRVIGHFKDGREGYLADEDDGDFETRLKIAIERWNSGTIGTDFDSI